MLEFIKENWQLILNVASLIFLVVVALIRKKPVTDIFYDIVVFSMEATKIVEREGILGAKAKLNAAITIVHGSLVSKYPELNVGSYDNFIKKTIENILETPKKKEV